MKLTVAVLFMSMAVCLAQFGPPNPFFFRRPSGNRRGNRFRSFSQSPSTSSRSGGGGGGGPVHHSDSQYDYHYSWLVGKNELEGGNAVNSYCRGLGPGWTGVSIESSGKNSFIQGLIGGRVPYIWTGATKNGRDFVWSNGNRVGASFSNWSPTGGSRRPQPDNRDAPENCLAVLGRQVYNDGVLWHDVKCSHRKPTVCERRKA